MRLLLIVSSLLVACSASSSKAKFSYKPDSEENPSTWASIDLGDDIQNQCGGKQQSGIDVPTHHCNVFADYVFSGGTCSFDDLDFKINSGGVVAAYNTTKNGCKPPQMIIPGQPLPFDAIQFHFHTGSDHALDGRYYGADLHLVHVEQGGSGRLSVLGFFVEPTDSDGIKKFRDLLEEWEAIAASTILSCDAQNVTIWSSLTTFPGENSSGITEQQKGGRRKTAEVDQEGQRRKLTRTFNPYQLIPKDSSMYTYQGSLTTPPCSEIVFWNVIDTPVSISIREFVRLSNLVMDYADPETCQLASEAAPSGFTGRPVQPINGRKIERICPMLLDDKLAVKECAESSSTSQTKPKSAAVPAPVSTLLAVAAAGIATLI